MFGWREAVWFVIFLVYVWKFASKRPTEGYTWGGRYGFPAHTDNDLDRDYEDFLRDRHLSKRDYWIGWAVLVVFTLLYALYCFLSLVT